MKIPAFAMQMIYRVAANNIGYVLATALEKVPHSKVIAKAYQNGEPLEVIIGLYLQSTESLKDDEVAARVGKVLMFLDTELPKILSHISEKSAREALESVLKDMSVPDFDNKKGNEMKVIDVINKAMKELAK
jgi:hypothetical protein